VYMYKFIISIFLFISLYSSTTGQEVKVTSAFDSTKIFIGDQIKYTVTLEKPADLKLKLPVLKDTISKNIVIVSGPRADSAVTRKGWIKITQKYLITSFDSGRYQVKPVFVEAKNEGGIKRYYSDYSMLEVMRVKIAPADTTAKIFDIVAPYRSPLTLGEVLPWLLLSILAGLLTWAVIRYINNHKKSETAEEIFIPADPAHVIAFRELERLKSEELWQKGEIKRFYTRLTEILRQYLENRFKVYSLELTTEETLEALIKSGFKKNGSYNELKSVLNGADLVKFAKYKPDATENEYQFQTSWKFVMTTKEDEQAPDSVEQKNNGKEVSL
jgi:hypothetical protein